MRNRILSLPALLAALGLMLLVGGSIAKSQQQPESLFAIVLKANRQDSPQKSPRPEEMAIVQEHIKYLNSLVDQGVCAFAGHTLNKDETAFGILVVRADSEAAARKIMEGDALVHAGLVRGTVLPFQVVALGKNAQH